MAMAYSFLNTNYSLFNAVHGEQKNPQKWKYHKGLKLMVHNGRSCLKKGRSRLWELMGRRENDNYHELHE